MIAAEKIKIEGASAYPIDSLSDFINVVGKDLLTSIPRSIKISKEEVREAIDEPISAILDSVRRALEKLPPEFVSDLNETGINVIVADDPLVSVTMGCGKSLEEMPKYKKVFIN